jgi:hypothetical protein
MAEEAKAPAKARVLVDHDGFTVDQIITGEDAARGHAEGWADGHPTAVKHAEKIARQKRRAANPDGDD